MARLGETTQRSDELPAVAGRPTGGQALPKVAPTTAYYLTWHPQEWHVMRGRVVPRLSKLPFTVGANGVDMTRDGKIVPQLAVQMAHEKGRTVLPWKVDGPDKPAYLYQAAHGGWVSRWERLFPGSKKTAVDEDGYSAWCESLVTRGVIPPAEDYIYDDLIDNLWSQLHNYRKDSQGSPRIERIRADIEVVKVAQTRLRAELEPLEPTSDDVPELGEPEPKSKK